MVDFYSPFTREDYLFACRNDLLLTKSIPVYEADGRKKKDRNGVVYERICFPISYFSDVFELSVERRREVLDFQFSLIELGIIRRTSYPLPYDGELQKGVNGWIGYDDDYGPLFVGTPF